MKKKVDELQQQNKRNAGRVAELEQALSGKETEYTVLRYELKTCKDDTTQIIKKAESLSSRVYDQDSELSQLRSENSELMKNINAASFKISELTSDIGKIRFERDEARKQKDQLSSELKKKDNYHNETKDLNEQNITSLKKEIESLQKNISSQKKSTITQFDELKKALEQRMQQTQQELFNSRRENQDLNQQLANLTSQNEMLGALSKELKRKCNKIEAEKANLTSNISDNTMSVMQNDVGTMKTLVQVEMKKAIDTLKQMEKDNQFLAYEVQKYHLHVEQKRNQGEDYDKEEPDRNAKLVKLVSDLKKIGKNPPTKADSTASFEQEIVQLTEELLSMNTVSGKTRSMKILSSKIQRKNESGVDGGNPGNKRLPPIRSASNLVAKDLTRKLQKLSKKDAELSSGGVKKVPAPAKAAPAKKQNLTSSSSGNNSRANHNYGGGEYDSTATTSKKQQAKQGVSKNIPKLPIATNKKASTRHVIEESASIPV